MTLTTVKVLENIKACIKELEEICEGNRHMDYNRYSHRGYVYNKGYEFKTRAVCEELSIFDWWRDTLSTSQLKQMKSFVETAIKLGFKGYVCFKVGASGCANGMWAYTNESTDGYSPDDGDCIYHSFVSTDNYWSAEINGKWISTDSKYKFTLAEVKEALKNRGN